MTQKEILILLKAINRVDGVVRVKAPMTAESINNDIELINEILVNELKKVKKENL